jgi:hypothetical protein
VVVTAKLGFDQQTNDDVAKLFDQDVAVKDAPSGAAKDAATDTAKSE